MWAGEGGNLHGGSMEKWHHRWGNRRSKGTEVRRGTGQARGDRSPTVTSLLLALLRTSEANLNKEKHTAFRVGPEFRSWCLPTGCLKQQATQQGTQQLLSSSANRVLAYTS